MPRRLLVHGQVYRLEPPGSAPVPQSNARLVWAVAGAAGLAAVSAGAVALLASGPKDPGPGRATIATAVPKPETSNRAPVEPPRPVPQVATAEPLNPAPERFQPRQGVEAEAPSHRIAPGPPPATDAAAGLTHPAVPFGQEISRPPTTPPVAAGPATPSVAALAEGAPAHPASPLSEPNPAAASTASLPAPGEEPSEPGPADGPETTPVNELLVTRADAPMGCLPAGLQSVLADLGARFGTVTVVSTTHLNTDNHVKGSVRDKLHEACKAVDFKVKGDSEAVLAYLKSRPEVLGINIYRNNGVIHIDHSDKSRAAAAPAPAKQAAPPSRRPVAAAKPAKPRPRRTVRSRPADAAPAVETGSPVVSDNPGTDFFGGPQRDSRETGQPW